MAQRSRLRTRGEKRRWFLICIPFIFALIGGILWYSLYYRPDVLEQLLGSWAFKQWHTPVNRDLIRGTIYDRNYKELAVSYERVSVYANIREIESLESITIPLAPILEEPEDTIADLLRGSGLRLWLAKDINQKQEDEIRRLKLPGIFLHKEHVRYHPQKKSAAHLVGFVENDTGLSGVEFYLNQLQTDHRINPGKVEELIKVGDSIPGADGRHLILTLDLKIQQILDQYVDEHWQDDAAISMGVLAIEATTGAVVGYAQAPSFDPNRFHTYSESVFSDVFNQQVAVPLYFKLFLREISLLESQSGGNLLPWSIVSEKRKLGVQLQLWEKLGVARSEKYDFISTVAANPESVAFDKTGTGHRDFETVPAMLTPLQMLTALSRSVNGEEKIALHVSDRYVVRRNQSEYLLEDLKPDQKQLKVQNGVASEIEHLLSTVGKSDRLNSEIVEGKSSSFTHQNGFKTFIRHHISFALIPMHKPELILMVVHSRPGYDVPGRNDAKSMSEISRLIVPVAARQKVMKNLADMMKPKEQEEKNFSFSDTDTLQSENMSGQAENKADVLIAKMPDLVGMSLRKSLRLLQNSGVEVKVNGTGRVVSHDPPAGSALLSGTPVVLNLERDEVNGGGNMKNSNN